MFIRSSFFALAAGVALLPASLVAQVRITEFMASNSKTLADDFGQYEDWIEIENFSPTNVNLLNWALTDNSSKPAKWLFPSTNLPPGSDMVVFASGRDRRIPGQTLHTGFKLAAGGGYLGLYRPDGSVATQFSPYPAQYSDVSYGFGLLTTNVTLISTGATARVLVPSVANGGSELNYAWTGSATNEPFDAGGWRSGPMGVGFSVGDPLVGTNSMMLRFNFDTAPSSNVVLDTKPYGTPYPGTNNGAVWLTSSTDGATSPTTRQGVMQFVAANANQITVATNSDFNTTNGTIMFWVRTTGTTGSGYEGAILFDRRTTSGDVIVLHDNGTIFVQAKGNGSIRNAFESATSIADDHWHHVAYVYDQGADGSISIYIDGALSKSQNNTAAWSWPATQRIELGRSHDTYWRRFDGYMDDVRIYNTMLMPVEIATVAAGDVAVNPGDIGTDVAEDMYGVNASAFVRIPFVIGNPTNVAQMRLSLKYDDGFAAWINGVPVLQANAPLDLTWNSSATGQRSGGTRESYSIGVLPGLLAAGTNILAIQGLNNSDKNPTFLISPELAGVSVAAEGTNANYFVTPTPGAMNNAGSTALGPIIREVAHAPNVPLDSEDLRVTAQIAPTFYAVSNVTMNYRVMFGSEVAVAMNDSGTNGDVTAGDGIWSGTIPASASTTGQMVRYYITAADLQTNTSRWPLFADPANSPEYMGTVVEPGYVTSKLPILHLFAPTATLQPGPTTVQTGADSEAGGRVSAFFDGEFYDNIGMSLRGNSTATYNKKSHRLEFNSEHQFRHAGPGSRLKNTSFVADYPDPTYMRQGLSFWLCEQLGCPSPFYQPYRLQLNGQFYQLANHNNVQGGEMLSYLGYDSGGALYKGAGIVVSNKTTTSGGLEMKTRTWSMLTNDTVGADYYDLAGAISEAHPTTERATNIFDRLDLPQIISYMVAARFVHENDDVWANMSLYHDNDGDNLWRIVPFDMNLSYGAAYLDTANLMGIQVTNDAIKSHPLYGSQPTYAYTGWNRMYDVIFQVPATREMFLRRMRTVLDTWVKPPGTPLAQLPIENKALTWRNLIATEAAVDRAYWGWAPYGGQNNFPVDLDLTNGVSVMFTDFLEKRRQHFYGKHSITNTALAVGIAKTNNAGFPLAQPSNAVVSIVEWDYNPVSGNQDEEYICLTNANDYAVDISGWKLGGGVSHTFRQSTVIPSHAALYATPSNKSFRNRAVAPHGGMGLFVQGGYNGRLSAWGEVMTLTDDAGRLVSSNSFVGAPSLPQQFLRITEIMYNPSLLAGNTNDAQSFEYIELKNISTNLTLDLRGVCLTNGVTFAFSGSVVTNLAAGQRVLVVRDSTAYVQRYGSSALIAGQYSGGLDNGGETLRLEDAVGEKILEFAYSDGWYPTTDGLGFSLVIVNELAHWSTWGDKSSWRPSGVINGSPGASDTAAWLAPVRVNEVLAHTDMPDVDTIELFNPASTNVDIGGWFLTDELATPKKYRIATGTVISAGGYLTFTANQFGVGTNGFLLSEYGDSAYVFSGDAATNLTGYMQGVDFAAAPNGVSFGRFVDSRTNSQFVLQSAATLGAANAYPRVGPIVISEIMYHPPDLAGGADDDLDEFIELQNITASNAPLYCVYTNEAGYGAAALTNTWRLRNAVDYDFSTNTSLPAGGRLLVVGFDPVANTAQTAAFRSLYAVPANVPIFGPWQGKLDNSAETIELKYPDKPDVTASNAIVPYVLVDKVAYTDTAPWPTNADGTGSSLQRRFLSGFGNDSTNWAARGVTAGQTNVLNLPPTILLTAPVDGATMYRTSSILLSATASDADGTIAAVDFWTGSNKLATVTMPPYLWSWTNAPIGVQSLTASATDNMGAARGTAPVRITVLSTPPTVTLTSPTNGASFLSGAAVSLAATAIDPDTPIAGVDFYADGTLVGTASGAPYTWTWTATTTGNHTLSAVARDETNSSPASAVVITVTSSVGAFTDNFAPRQVLTGYTNYAVGNNSAYTSEGNETTPPAGNKAHSAWISWTAPASGTCKMDTIGSGFDTVIAIYTNNPATLQTATNLAVVAYNDDGDGYTTSKASFAAVSGKTYQVGIYGYTSSDVGSIVFHQSLTAAPTIITAPQSQTVVVGTNAIFTVSAAGSAPLNYQWRFFGTNLAGVTAATCTITNVQVSNAGDYTVVVTNSAGSVTSAVAVLTVASPPAITTQPQSQTAAIGSNAVFTVTAGGAPPLSYQWRFLGTNLPGAITNSLSLTNVQYAQAGAYVVVVTNSLGSVTSSVATLTVTLPPVMTTVFPTNSVWRYLDNGSDQGTNWIAPGFADAAWSSGAGKFGFNTSTTNAGFATVLSWGTNSSNKYTTYYFRKQFTVASLVGITNLLLEYMRDDGVVFYLNGVEVTRNNVSTASPVTYTTLATNCSDNGATLFAALLSTNNLIIGTNTIAAEVHQSAVSSSDLVFDARLTLAGVWVSPSIGTQPQSQTVVAGNPVFFTLAASGTEPMGYQWRFNGTNLAGATGVSYVIPSVQSYNAGSYAVMVTNMAGSATSAVATLIVNLPTPIMAAIGYQAGTLLLTWSGGVPPYQVEAATNLTSPSWQNAGAATTNRSLTLTPSVEKSFYRVRGQ